MTMRAGHRATDSTHTKLTRLQLHCQSFVAHSQGTVTKHASKLHNTRSTAPVAGASGARLVVDGVELGEQDAVDGVRLRLRHPRDPAISERLPNRARRALSACGRAAARRAACMQHSACDASRDRSLSKTKAGRAACRSARRLRHPGDRLAKPARPGDPGHTLNRHWADPKQTRRASRAPRRGAPGCARGR